MIAFLLTPLLLAASPGEAETLSQAANAYHAGLAARADANEARSDFADAADAFEQAWDADRHTPEVACNAAQARFLAGDLGRCIRDYRRGLRVSPADPELRRGLAFARDRVAYPVNGDVEKAARPRVVESPLTRIGIAPTKLTVGALIVWLIGWALVARAWMIRRGGLAVLGVACLLVAVAVGTALWWWTGRDDAPAAVVISPGTELRLGNNDEFPRRIDGRLPAGVEVRVLGERGGWLQVELADGTAGWLPRERVVLVD